jgi:S-adenosylmethionine-diacylgycerolhomoserine-N-methlytransferase
MSLAEVRTLWQLFRGMPGGSDHARRLEAFYGPQAGDYDRFRERLLPGRAELLDWLMPAPGSRIVELGAGTGRNPVFLGPRLTALAQVTLVDLCPSLLAEARRRWTGIGNVTVVEGDACTWQPDTSADAVYFSYALTMIPDWRAAMANAIAMLRPGGRLAVVDFTVSPDQSRVVSAFWHTWFGHDGVRLDADHVAALRQLLPRHTLREHRTRVPYLPRLTVPYYLFLGIKE